MPRRLARRQGRLLCQPGPVTQPGVRTASVWNCAGSATEVLGLSVTWPVLADVISAVPDVLTGSLANMLDT